MTDELTFACTVYMTAHAVGYAWGPSSLTVTRAHLRLSSMVQTYEFSPGAVVDFERLGLWPTVLFPFFADRILLHHTVEEYPQPVCVWWPFHRATSLLNRICQTGFTPSAEPLLPPWEPGSQCRLGLKEDEETQQTVGADTETRAEDGTASGAPQP